MCVWLHQSHSASFIFGYHFRDNDLKGLAARLMLSGAPNFWLACWLLGQPPMFTFFAIFVGIALALALVGWLADRRADARGGNVTPSLSLLPGDFKYESPNGNARIYFPIATSIVLSIVATLVLRFFS